jgi:hypothetical protein
LVVTVRRVLVGVANAASAIGNNQVFPGVSGCFQVFPGIENTQVFVARGSDLQQEGSF